MAQKITDPRVQTFSSWEHEPFYVTTVAMQPLVEASDGFIEDDIPNTDLDDLFYKPIGPLLNPYRESKGMYITKSWDAGVAEHDFSDASESTLSSYAKKGRILDIPVDMSGYGVARYGNTRLDFRPRRSIIVGKYNYTGKNEAYCWDVSTGHALYRKKTNYSDESWRADVILMAKTFAAKFARHTLLDGAPTCLLYFRVFKNRWSGHLGNVVAMLAFGQYYCLPGDTAYIEDFIDMRKQDADTDDEITSPYSLARQNYFNKLAAMTAYTTSPQFYDLSKFLYLLALAPAYGVSLFPHDTRYGSGTKNLNIGVYVMQEKTDHNFKAPESVLAISDFPLLGYSADQSLLYVNAIENYFSEQMAELAAENFFSNVDRSKQTDETLLAHLASGLYNQYIGLDALLDSPVPVYMLDAKGDRVGRVLLSIPEEIPDPRDESKTYYPRKRIKEIHKFWTGKALSRWHDLVGSTYAKSAGDVPDADLSLGDPSTNMYLVVDTQASMRAGRLVYRDTSKNKLVTYQDGRLVTYGDRGDYEAYLAAFERGEKLLRKPTTKGGLTSAEDLYNLGMPEERPEWLKFLVPAAAAVGAAIYFGGR